MELINELCQDLALTYDIWLAFDFFYLLTAISHLLPWRPFGRYLGMFSDFKGPVTNFTHFPT